MQKKSVNQIEQIPSPPHPFSSSPAHPLTPAPRESVNIGQLRQAIELALRLGDPASAAQAARALTQRFPEAIAPVMLLGRALLDLGQLEAAIEQFRHALMRNPLESAAWIGLAGALSLTGQRRAAEAALRRAALHDPLDSEMLTPGIAQPPPDSLGVVYLRRGYAAMAAAELANVLNQSPKRNDLRIYYAEALRRSGELNDARQQLALLLRATSTSLPILLLRAALDTARDDATNIRGQCARYDLDGQMTRRFFAPEHLPWSLPPTPALTWDAAFDPLPAYLPHAISGQKSAVQHSVEPPIQPQTGDRLYPIDPDVSAFMTTATQLRQRLAAVAGGPRPLVPWNGADRQAQVLLACKGTLRRRYGDAGLAAIDRRLGLLADALRRRGVQAYCCYLDDPASLEIGDQIALAPVGQEAGAIRELVCTLGGAFAQQRQELGTLLLIGGDDSIPFHRLPNPLHDDDEAVLSDTPYGSDDAGYMLPQRVIARLPDGADDNPALLLALLDQMIDYHHGRGPRSRGGFRASILGIGRAVTLAQPTGDAGYSAEVWREASRAVLDTLGIDTPLSSSPPLDADTLDLASLLERRILYVNLHGATGLASWYGQPDVAWPGAATRLPIALRPEHFADRRMAGGLLISEACYGVELASRSAQTSIPLRALAEGALACVGATVSAYGSVSTPLIGADLLCQRLLTHLAAGVPIGEALRQARLEFAQTLYRRQGYLDDVDSKTLTEFVLLGDPWAAVESSSAAPASWPVSKLAGIERVPKPRPKAVLDEAQVPRDLLQRAREVLRRILPEGPGLPLHITVQPSLRPMRKSDDDQELTFSAQNRRLTADGHTIAQTALVTVSGRAVVKVALTH